MKSHANDHLCIICLKSLCGQRRVCLFLDDCQGAVPGRTDAPEFTAQRCQHRRLRVGGAVRRTRFGPIRQKTADRKSLECRRRDYTRAKIVLLFMRKSCIRYNRRNSLYTQWWVNGAEGFRATPSRRRCCCSQRAMSASAVNALRDLRPTILEL